jgi:hypothetical protein
MLCSLDTRDHQLAATDYKLGLSVLYLFNSVDDLAVIKLIPLLIHDMEHCTKVEHLIKIEKKEWKDLHPNPKAERHTSFLLNLSKTGMLQAKALTIHEPLPIRGNVGPLYGQLQIGQYLDYLQQGPILVRTVHLHKAKGEKK